MRIAILARALAYLSLPQNACLSATLVYATVDNIWAAGRHLNGLELLLKKHCLRGCSLQRWYWLNDRSKCHGKRAFLDRRIENVMQIPRLKNNFGTIFYGVLGDCSP